MRMQRLCDEHEPLLEGYDEWSWVTEHNYAATDPIEQSHLFRERRAEIIKFLRTRHLDDWSRSGLRPEIGMITLEGIALLIPMHDTYHLHEIAAWRKAGTKG
jgi:hypothetical protein